MSTAKKNVWKLVLLFALALVVIVFLLAVINREAFAQEAQPKDQNVVHVSGEAGKDTKMVLKAPGPGQTLTVIVDVPVLTRKVKPAPTYITNETHLQGSKLRLRGGVSVGTGLRFPARFNSSLTGGLTGEISYTDSPWILETTFRAGNCKEGMALDSGLAVMRQVAEHFRMGVGADLFYCSNIADPPREKASERVVGGSFRLQFEYSHFSVAGSVGVGAATYPIPGDRRTDKVLYEGLSVSYLF